MECFMTHNTKMSGSRQNVPVIWDRSCIDGDKLTDWHESTAAELRAYESYWNYMDDKK